MMISAPTLFLTKTRTACRTRSVDGVLIVLLIDTLWGAGATSSSTRIWRGTKRN
ncbi:hypothetical protein PF005_g33257 [Phytophthora fragariae]|uniref:Uncharacterized protein n=1 Tax=Phytophthora fragariae TaxID=53985 RepID=A0A6A3UZ36_9STRA|nr:hypothetical protein PF003_g19809 [Phytophthora fragariae]KAE8916579.1 hypothetical protein PF009_g33098 [Phytophthora fragariae]KAE9055591.1 hypothetical protein PF010_g32095 [Phytophthora fragariae]KAE9055690.1 hypothetical protein PF006_g32888 [Phytophthora fragariae]KAE9069373.1 hypothetical protein PF007_g27345 [Phytophthora fragariae]